MGLQVIEHELATAGSPAAVYALLADGSTWPEWSPIGSFELEKPGVGTPDGVGEGVGAVRIFTTGRIRSRERVVAAQPDELFSYTLISGLAVRDYRAVVTLRPADSGGTVIHWRSTFKAKVPGTGWIYQRQLSAFIGRTVNGLAAWASTSSFSRPESSEAADPG
jgi:Polyketide cyclase / dehydrase and lipid transport